MTVGLRSPFSDTLRQSCRISLTSEDSRSAYLLLTVTLQRQLHLLLDRPNYDTRCTESAQTAISLSFNPLQDGSLVCPTRKVLHSRHMIVRFSVLRVAAEGPWQGWIQESNRWSHFPADNVQAEKTGRSRPCSSAEMARSAVLRPPPVSCHPVKII